MYLDNFVSKASSSLQESEVALNYLASRGFSIEDARRWGLGYTRIAKIANNGSDDWEKLKKETYGFKTLEERLLIPLHNILGRVNGIQTRMLTKKVYKDYLMFEAKSIGAFFGLYEALPSIRKTRRVFVHEGAFNAMSFAKVFPNSVASMTSFLGEPQVELLRYLVDLIVVVFDNDVAGDIGREKLIKYYGDKGFEFVILGDSDANDCLRFMSPGCFTNYIKSRVPSLLRD